MLLLIWLAFLLWFAFILWTTDICNNQNLIPIYPYPLWFAFILWTTDICNNSSIVFLVPGAVVICFHSLNNWYLQQLRCPVHESGCRCDLLSFFEQLIFATTRYSRTCRSYSCDLLSFFEQLIFATTDFTWCWCSTGLWFAFILWTTDICNNSSNRISSSNRVVICFHSLNNWYLQQHHCNCSRHTGRCDLLSFFEQLIFATTLYDSIWSWNLLWFAFILWTTDICNNGT